MYNYDKLKNDIETQLQLSQCADLYDLKKLNKEDEAENILIMKNTIFLGNNRMQIKKLDGTIEKYNIERYYPVDEKDEEIKELHKKIEELERRIGNEPTKYIDTTRELNKSTINDDEYVEPNTKEYIESVSNKE